MENIKIEWTPEKVQRALQMIENWIRANNAVAGEVIMQNDECLISAPELLADIVDDVIQPFYQ
jgi:hypothetical protein